MPSFVLADRVSGRIPNVSEVSSYLSPFTQPTILGLVECGANASIVSSTRYKMWFHVQMSYEP